MAVGLIFLMADGFTWWDFYGVLALSIGFAMIFREKEDDILIQQ